MTTKLFNHTDLSRKFKLDSSTIGKLLEQANVKPEQQLRAGRGLCRFYTMEAAGPVITKYLEEKAARRAAKYSAPSAPPHTDIEAQLQAIDGKLDALMRAQNTILVHLYSLVDGRIAADATSEPEDRAELTAALEACLSAGKDDFPGA